MDDVCCAREHGVRPLKLAPKQVRAIRADRAAEVVHVLERVLDAEQMALSANALRPVR